jgi:hypothetical protein
MLEKKGQTRKGRAISWEMHSCQACDFSKNTTSISLNICTGNFQLYFASQAMTGRVHWPTLNSVAGFYSKTKEALPYEKLVP